MGRGAHLERGVGEGEWRATAARRSGSKQHVERPPSLHGPASLPYELSNDCGKTPRTVHHLSFWLMDPNVAPAGQHCRLRRRHCLCAAQGRQRVLRAERHAELHHGPGRAGGPAQSHRSRAVDQQEMSAVRGVRAAVAASAQRSAEQSSACERRPIRVGRLAASTWGLCLELVLAAGTCSCEPGGSVLLLLSVRPHTSGVHYCCRALGWLA